MTSADKLQAASQQADFTVNEGTSLTERVIHDPMASVVAGIVAPTAAFGFVLSAMWGIALVS